ncbi:MAG: NAD(P)-dependent alcohol dehydrogenase [Sphingomonadales bacterium]
MDIQAAVLREPHKPFSIEALDLEDPGPHEVRVKIAATGLCHTDLVVRDGLMPAPYPIVVGHEGAGTVAAVGAHVTKVKPGDTVVLSYLSCGTCRCCVSGQSSYCVNILPLNFSGQRPDGTTPLRDKTGARVHGMFFSQSSFATYALASERNVVPVPDAPDIAQLGPLGCGLLTGAGAVFNVLKPGPGANMVVYGVGGVGLSASMAARSLGVTNIIAVDRHSNRLEKALELGAAHAIDASTTDVLEAVLKLTKGGADTALETTGVPAVLRTAVDGLAMPGTVGFVGVAAPGAEVKLDMPSLMFGRRIIGIVEGDAVPDILIPHLVDLYRDGRFPIDAITTTYPLDAINQAAHDSETGKVIKPLLQP